MRSRSHSIITGRVVTYAIIVLLALASCSSYVMMIEASSPKNVAEASISNKLGDSTLVDKETGQVYWHSGPRATLPYMDFKHVKATILTALLFMSALSMIMGKVVSCKELWLRSDGKKRIAVVAWTTVCSAINSILPKFSQEFIILIGILYLVEAYTCSTRQYLSNIMSPREVESLIETLRGTPPSVTWKVRCFHYENRLLGSSRDQLASSKKITTHTATKEYQFGSWRDNTVVSIWERAKALTSATAPFTKISLSKMLVLSDMKARQDYFSQQASFIALEGRRDDHAEFSTTINVKGFKPKLLAVRTVIGAPKTGIVKYHLFWLFTLLGLTVPYRKWFSSHCDDLCVTIVKETTAFGVYPRKPLLPKLWSTKVSDEEVEDVFVRNMKEYSLYSIDEENVSSEIGVTEETLQLQSSISNSSTKEVTSFTNNDSITNDNQSLEKDASVEDITQERDTNGLSEKGSDGPESEKQ